MGTSNVAPAPNDSPAAGPPAHRDWLDAVFRLATSWVGLFTAYATAVLLALTQLGKLSKGLQDIGIRPGLGIALIAALPLLALVFSTIPTFIEQRRIKRYSEITGAIETGYFTLRPRDDEEHFGRADNVHQDVLRWIENAGEPVFYLTGASGTGKSSLLSAWVIPRLRRKKHVVIQLRGYEDDLLARVKEELVQPGTIWERAPANTDDLRSLLDRAAQRLNQSAAQNAAPNDASRRLFIVVDQFEEFLILKDENRRSVFRQFLVDMPDTGSVTFLLVYRPEYESFFENQPWPRLKLDTNRKVITAFTENAAQEFMGKSGLTVNADLMRAVLREAAEIEQTTGLIRPVTINLCGLVLSRFASGLPRRFRGGLIRGFLRESVSLPEVRDVAGKLIPQLITDNVTKRPRTIADLAQATLVAPAGVRACLRRLGESDRAIVRPLDEQQETWEISHDFLVPLLDSIVARRTVSWWRSFRPWLPWTAAAVMGIAAVAVPLMTRQDPRVELTRQGWTVSENLGVLNLYNDNIPPESVPVLRSLPPFVLTLSDVRDISALRELKNLTELNLSNTSVNDASALRELKNLTQLDLSETKVTDVSVLRELKSLTQLNLGGAPVTDVSALRELKNLTSLNLGGTLVTDVSALRELKNLTQLDLGGTNVMDVSALRELKDLEKLDLSYTKVTDVSALRELENLFAVDLSYTKVTDAEVSALQSALPNLKISRLP